MNYQIITDMEALEAFVKWLPDLLPHEKYYLCLFARKKYCATVGYIKTDKSQMKRFLADKERMIEKIRQLECPLGSYMQKGNPIPQEALALYITTNPRNLWKANFDAIGDLGKVIQCEGRTSNPHQEVMSSIQRSRGTKHFIDFDIDNKDPGTLERIQAALPGETVNQSYFILETRGGYHVLVNPKLLTGTYVKGEAHWHNELSKMADITGDKMIPVPGTHQGGFTPRFLQPFASGDAAWVNPEATPAAPPEQSACAAVIYECKDCGEFEVIKSHADLSQPCYSCGLAAQPKRISYLGIRVDGDWAPHRLL